MLHGKKKSKRERERKGDENGEKERETGRHRLEERVDIAGKPRLPRYARPGELICTKHRCVFAAILINDRGGRTQPFPPLINQSP